MVCLKKSLPRWNSRPFEGLDKLEGEKKDKNPSDLGDTDIES